MERQPARGLSAAGPQRAAAYLCLSLAAGVAVGQLPPQIQADRYLLEAESAIRERNYEAAKVAMDRTQELETQHEVELPEDYFYQYAQVLRGLGLHAESSKAVRRYLELAGREGEHYREALELLSAAEAVSQGKGSRTAARAVAAQMEFIEVPAGELLLGSTSEEAAHWEGPVTRVRISQGFWLGKYEVTQWQWEAVMGSNPSEVDDRGPNCPVDSVSWEDAQAFIARLNEAVGTVRYRLPTEAEWEYAARAGTVGDRYSDSVDEIAWHNDNGGLRTHPVGQKAANAWGFHDMLGNVVEWVQDWFWRYPGGTLTDPAGPGSGSHRVHRGGSWILPASSCRAPSRAYDEPDSRYPHHGFRLLRTE